MDDNINLNDEQEVIALWDWKLTNHTPNAEGIEQLRRDAKQMVRSIIQNCPNSRERSLALTHLESASMSAIAAIARNPKFTDDRA